MNLHSRKGFVNASHFYGLMFVALTGILGMVSPPDLALMTAQAQTVQDRNAEAMRLLRQGQQFVKSEQYKKSLDSFQQSLAIFRQLGNTKIEPPLLYAIGTNYIVLKNIQKGREFLLQSIELAKKIGDRETETLATNFLRRMSQSVPASTIQDPNAEAVRLFNQGFQFTKSKQYQKAIDSFQQSLAILRQLKDTKFEPYILYAIAANYVSLEDFYKAEEFLLDSIELAQKIGDWETESKATDLLEYVRD